MIFTIGAVLFFLLSFVGLFFLAVGVSAFCDRRERD